MINEFKARELWPNYNDKVIQYMQNVIDCLKADYGNIPLSWKVTLDLIADNYSIYIDCLEKIKEEGLLYKDDHKRLARSKYFGIMNIAQDHVIKLTSSMALTPMSRSKMKKVGTIEEDEYDNLIK